MIRVDHFFQALKCSWIKRYVVNAVDDHWGDLLDIHLKLTPDTREDLLLWGSEKLNSIISKKIPCISSILTSYKRKFPNCSRMYGSQNQSFTTITLA